MEMSVIKLKIINSDAQVLSKLLSCLIIGCLVAPDLLFAEIYTCKDQHGKRVFTDNSVNCGQHRSTNDAPAETIELPPLNLHSRYGQHISEEYYNYAFRAYQPVKGYQLEIIAETRLVDEHPQLLSQAATRLAQIMEAAIALFPAQVRLEFKGIRYFLFLGEESRTGGRKGGQWYFRRGNNTSARFNDSIVIRSAADYLRYTHEWALQTAVHELSHAYFYYHRQQLIQPLQKAFSHARKNNLHLNVLRQNGTTVLRAYAMTNRSEYFAEMAKTVFTGNWHYPFNKVQLEHYDPMGYQLVKDAFAKNW